MAKIAKKHAILPGTRTEYVNEKIMAEYDERYRKKLHHLRTEIQNSPINNAEKQKLMNIIHNRVKDEVDDWYRDRLRESQDERQELEDEELDRKTILNRMYSLTAKAKIPLIAELLEKWHAEK